ncbi:MAG TPA: amidohydrolase [Candidatus Acidoferrum sp.]|nr:amidohydrolase [Candidatus Acidoferrum sp.]
MSPIVLLADQVVTLDATATIYAPGAVTIEGAEIRAVGPPPERPTGQIVDLRGSVLLPGLVNTHTHSPMWVFRGLTEDVPRGEWLTGRLLPLERRLGPDDLRCSAMAGCLELLQNGVTTIADRYGHMDAVASAVEASGLRAVVGHSLFDRTADADLAASERLIERFGTDPARSRVWAGLAPHATDTCGADLLGRVRRLADRSGARVFIHVAQSEEEVATVIARGAAGCASYLDALGLLAPDVVAAHGTYLTDGEADLLGRRGTAVAHCPSSNAKLEGRIAPIARMRRAGAVVGLGTDAACCNNGMDLFEEMKVAALLNKVAADDPAAFPALDVLRMATSEAARVLGIDHLVGSLEPGKRADIIAVRTRSPRLQPWLDPIANLVYAARGSDVAAVFVDGRQLVRNGRPVYLDPDRILADAAQAGGQLADVRR